MGAIACRRHADIGRDRRGVSEQRGGMAGNIRVEGTRSKCKEKRSHLVTCTRS